MTIDVAVVMRTLADPTRRAVFEQIVESGEVTVGTLTRRSTVSQPAISQHLRALKEAGLVAERREGRNVHYHPQANGLAPLINWLGVYGLFWRERFARLEGLLKEIDHDGRNAKPGKTRNHR
jgi:DNA-binding transcriptional ArsR family regulator